MIRDRNVLLRPCPSLIDPDKFLWSTTDPFADEQGTFDDAGHTQTDRLEHSVTVVDRHGTEDAM